MIFGMSQHEVNVEPCSRIEITFVNEDEVRHQWMVHGLPKYLYPAGMFHIEANGGYSMKGTFIVPSDDHTYLVHCDMAQHMEKGMRGQLVVGKGSGDLWGVPGVSDEFYRFNYLPATAPLLASLVFTFAFLASLWLSRRL
jgi:plastocyanin